MLALEPDRRVQRRSRPASWMSVRIRLIGESAEELDEAIFALTAATTQLQPPARLELRAPRKGRRGEWLAYGTLTV
jgi:hypothetical protein